ncbi:MAG: Crp/Fnr family transcriptional regulator [Bacteroidota bacterium]|nr:Crp/Fnr family transcriptional regulator [Bacteroidota bacterium]
MIRSLKKCSCTTCKIKSIAISILSDKEICELCDNSIQISFLKGEKIFKQGAFTTNIVFIKSGIVKIHLTGPLNKEEILKIDKGPIFVGLPSVFADKIHKYSVTALTQTEACFINFATFKEFILHNGKFAHEILIIISRDTIEHFNRCVNKTQKQLTASTAETLLYFSNHIFHSDTINIPLTRTEFGAYIGTTRETITRIIHDFTDDNLIENNGKNIIIKNKKILEKISKTG